MSNHFTEDGTPLRPVELRTEDVLRGVKIGYGPYKARQKGVWHDDAFVSLLIPTLRERARAARAAWREPWRIYWSHKK